jgi:membrane fusion protein, multidrug efflux system
VPPPAVVVEIIQVREVSDPASFTARVEAIEAVDIRACIQGFLRSVAVVHGGL